MAAIHCTPCTLDNRQEIAEGYCEVCTEYLCETCINYHQRFRMTKGHKILLGEDIPDAVTDKSVLHVSCKLHTDEFVKYFCLDHEKLGCGSCMAFQHPSCKKDLISNLAKTYRSSDEYKNVIGTIENTEQHINKTLQFIPNQGEKANDMNESARQDMQNFRRELNKFLDEREATLCAQMTTLHESNKEVLQDFEGQSTNLLNEIQCYKTLIEDAGNDSNKLFITAKSIKENVNKLHLDIIELTQRHEIKYFHFCPSDTLRQLAVSEEFFGKISITESALSVASDSLPVDDSVTASDSLNMDIMLDKSIKIKGGDVNERAWITSMSLLTPERLLIADWYNRSLNVIEIKSQAVSDVLKCEDQPWEVCITSNNRVAVTLPRQKKIQIVSTKSDKLNHVKYIQTSNECRGICFYDDKLVVTFVDPGTLQIIDICTDTVLQTFSVDTEGKSLFQRPLHVASLHDGSCDYVYISDINCVSLVTLNSPDGNTISKIKSPISSARGMVDLGNKQIAVCSNAKDSIHVFSELCGNTKLVKIWECVDRPLSMAYCGASKTLYVASGGSKGCGFIHIYKLT